MQPMRVLYVDHTAKIGGGEVALYNLMRHIDGRLVRPVVVLFEEGPLVGKLLPIVETHVLPLDSSVSKASKDTLGPRSLSNMKAQWYTLRHVFRLARFARRKRIDLIHTNSLKADIIGGLAGRLTGIPVIWHVRDRIDEDYLPKSIVHLFRFLSHVIPQHIVGNSEATLATLRLRASRKRTVVPSGVVLRTGNSGEAKGPHNRDGPAGDAASILRVALVGRISPWKGQDVFLRAAAMVIERVPNTRFEIVGAPLFAEREYEQSLHVLCRQLDIEAAVHFSGFVEDVCAYISQIDVLVHASTTGEPFGQVIVEGMAEAKPVVATNGGGVPEIVVDGSTGLLVPMGDAAAMADAIVDLLENPEKATMMGRLGRERVLQRFTIERAARMVEGVYRQVCPSLSS